MGQHPRPISEEKQLITLGRVLQTLREEDNVDVLIDTTVNYLQAEFNYSLIWIAFYDRLDHRILGKGGITPSGDISFLKQRFFLSPGDLLEQVVIQQRPLGIPDLQEENRAGAWRKAAQNYNVRGTLIFPIRYRDRCFGVIMLGQPIWGVSPRSEEKARISMLLGGLASALNQIESDWQRGQTKRPDEPLLALLQEMPALPNMWQRLEAVVTQTHEFVKPTRTSIYWYEPERRYFWRRVGNRTPGTMAGKDTAAGITVQEAGGFYSAMVGDQLVSIGEAQSSLKADVTSRLLQRLGVRSLLAAPILLQEELLGFLAVEGNDPRIWQEEEKNYIRSAAKLVAMLAPIEQMEATIEQTKQDQILTAELARAIATEEDGHATLKTCGERLFERLQQARFLVVLFDRDLGQFEICYQTHPPNRQPVGESLRFSSTSSLSQSTTLYLPLLSEVDWQWIERSRDAVEIEDLSSDLKIMAWRDELLEMGARSLILCNTSLGHPLEAMLILAYETPRTWTSAEREIIRIVAQQLGVILHQWQLQRQTHRQQHLFQTLQQGLTALATNQPTSQYEFDLYTYERAILQPIAQMLAAPCVVLITWSPGEQVGRIIPGITGGNQQFSLSLERLVPLSDELIQAAIVGDGLIAKNIDEVSSSTRQWLNAPGIGEILAIALRTTPEHEPMGVVVVCDERGRHWPESALPVFGLLVTQLAWYRRYLRLTLVQTSFRQELEQLNWYKHRFLEEFHRSVEAGVKNLFQMSETFNITSVQRDAELFQTRVRQICQQLGSTLNEVTETAEAQMWKMRPIYELTRSGETVSITSMLRRSLERVDTLLKERKLWSQVREAKSESPMPSQFSFTGELCKIELILHEILVAACQRAPEGGRIDIWYRLILNPDSSIPHSILELSITDNGTIDSQLVAELKQRLTDELAPSKLNQPPGLHLRICQSLVQQIGGQLKFYQVEDGRVLTRLLLPISNG